MGKRELSKEYGDQNIYYDKYYSEVIGNNSRGLAKWFSSYPHRLIEAPFKNNLGMKILEVGSGENEHIQFVKSDFCEYISLDKNPPKNTNLLPNAYFKLGNAESLSFNDCYFDRFIMTCVLLHLNDPEQALLEARRVTKIGGRLSFYVPPEPSLLLSIFRELFPKRRAKALGFEGYDLFIARDHINYFKGIREILLEVFKKDVVKIIYRPFPLRTWYLNAVVVFQITKT